VSAYLISEEVLREVLNALNHNITNYTEHIPLKRKQINVLGTLLASPPAKPVAWTNKDQVLVFTDPECLQNPIPLFRKDL